MREMKNSGIAWAGVCPSPWKTEKFKYHFKRRTVKNPGEAQVLSLYREYGVIPKDSRDDNHNVTSEDTSKYLYVRKGDFVINKMKAWQGSVAVSEYEGIVSPAYYVYEFVGKTTHRRYIHYLMRNKALAAEFRRLSGGIREGQWDLAAASLENSLIFIPPMLEQQAIADFLDTKSAEIDALMEDIRAEISTLEEYKKSVITEAVTKGLNPDVEMKDSGVAWVGEIPGHWEIVNPKSLFTLRKDKAFSGQRQLTASQQYGVIYQDEYMNLTGNKVVIVEKDFDILKQVKAGDFVISMRSFQGGLEYSPYDGSISSAYNMLIPNTARVHNSYYKWLLKSPGYIRALQSTSNLIRDGQAMRYSNFAKVPLPSLPLKEQQTIADYLDPKCAEIEATIAEKQKQLTILEEYKKSLIYEYVTGKKEVPTL